MTRDSQFNLRNLGALKQHCGVRAGDPFRQRSSDAEAMVRRWKQARRTLADWERDRAKGGGPADEGWHFPWWIGALQIAIFAIPIILLMVAEGLFSAEIALAAGIVLVVALGAIGQILRGVGEFGPRPLLKAWGYYCGAAAYVATAGVALLNGVPHLLAR